MGYGGHIALYWNMKAARMAYAGIPAFCGLGSEDGHVPT